VLIIKKIITELLRRHSRDRLQNGNDFQVALEYVLSKTTSQAIELRTEFCEAAQSIRQSSLAWTCQHCYAPWNMPMN